ncbi:metal-dependent amidase/aminoacylase/carboxypeptidase family protein [Aeribacillus sp. SP014]
MEGTIRTFSVESMEKVKKRIEDMVKGIEIGYQCKAEIDWGSMYYQVWNDEALSKEFMEFVQNETEVQLHVCKEAMTGEDFGYMLAKIPGFMFWLGVDSPYGLHHAKLSPNEQAIFKAVDLICQYFEWKGNK